MGIVKQTEYGCYPIVGWAVTNVEVGAITVDWMGSNVIIKIRVQVGSLLLRFLYKDFSDDSSKTEFKLVAYT